MIEVPRAKTAGTRVEMNASKTRPGKDDDCAQNNGFTPAALFAYREGRKAGKLQNDLRQSGPLPAQRPSRITPVSRKACEHANIRRYVTLRHHSGLTGSAVNSLLVDSNKIIACIISIC
jgi:hypothetical protein